MSMQLNKDPVVTAVRYGTQSYDCRVQQSADRTHLWEQMVHHVGANVVVDLVEHAIVAVDGGQPATQVAPLLAPECTGNKNVIKSTASDDKLCNHLHH